jgi:hypothetical protein
LGRPAPGEVAAYLAHAAGRLVLVTSGGGRYQVSAFDSAQVRNNNVTIWDPAQETTTSRERLRPDCWLSTVPAVGLLLSPEAGGGCSCGSWLETSIAFRPKVRQP